MKKIIDIISSSKPIIASLVLFVFVAGFSIGYQVCLHLKQCDTVWLNDEIVPNETK